MKEVLNAVEEDKLAGVHKREDGRFYFVQRKVEFSTIDFKPEYIFSNSWGIFPKPLQPINWNVPIQELERQLLQFSAECSERFHHLWYYYIDIMIARSLSSNDKNIFIKDFIIPSIFLDIGIPENTLWTNVPKSIHQKILKEYNTSLKLNSNYQIFYLSQYLLDLTKDIIEFVKPYHALWNLEKEKLNAYTKIKKLMNSIFSRGLFAFIKEKINFFLKENLLDNQFKFSNKFLENIYFRFKNDPLSCEFSFIERRILLEHILRYSSLKYAEDTQVKNQNFLILLNEFTNFPYQLEKILRRILFLENIIFKEEIVKIRQIYIRTLKNKNLVYNIYEALLKNTEKVSDSIQEKFNLIVELTEYLNLEHFVFWESLADIYEEKNIQNLRDLEISFHKIIKGEIPLKDNIKKEIFYQIKQIRIINKEIIDYYIKNFSFEEKLFSPNPKYLDKIEVKKFIPGNPFQEKEIIFFLKELIKQRLKPIRMASNDYSLLAKEKHGILTLNPVLKLWKNQVHFQKDLPEIVQLELNTPITIECLLELLFLVDKKIKERELLRGKIVKQIRGKENIENMKFLLLPGSCYPIKEIPSRYFPEFKYKIIGEKRTYKEVGVSDTHYILTGCWYNKKNHTLYYPIGGDNAELLKRIYLGIKSNIIPAFFFAIGQFVFECLSDTILYYKNQKLTFREVLYKIKKNQNRDDSKFRLYSKSEIKFEFAILYSQLIMENLTGSLHIRNKVTDLYKWFFENLGIQSFFTLNKEERKNIRMQSQKIIEKYNFLWLKLVS
ncbi:MAG: hypothetical protein ACK4UJ_05840 [Leptonema sp. (in: bacteria)]